MPNLLKSKDTGRYFNKLKKVPLKGPARDTTLARRLWDDAAKTLEVA